MMTPSRANLVLAIGLSACGAKNAGVPGQDGGGGAGGAAGGATGMGGATTDGPATTDAPTGPIEPVSGCSSDGWCWLRPRPTGSLLYNISGRASNDVWASGEAGAALHWDGRAWTSHAVEGELYDVWSVWTVGPNDAWAAGDSGFFHWDGAHWILSVTAAGGAISGVGNDVWAVSSGTFMHLVGSSWATQLGPGSGCSQLWVASATDMWLACDSLYHFDGSAFTDAGIGKGVTYLSASGPSEVWAANGAGELRRWNGSVWALSTGYGGNGVWSLSVRGPGDVWVLDRSDTLFHLQGSSWRQTWRGSPSQTRGVFATGNDVWVSGANGMLARGDGSTFAPSTEATLDQHVWARSTFGIDPGRVWFGTDDGVQVWDGTTMSRLPGTEGRSFSGLWASAADDLWMVDNSGSLTRWNGSSIQTVMSGGASPSLSGTSPNDVWSGFKHWDGQTWTVTGAGDAGYSITAMWASGPTDAWAVGSDGYVKHWDGVSWTRMTGVSSMLLTAVWGTGPGDVWIGGDYEQISRWDGQKWTSMHRGQASSQIRGFAGRANDVWALGGKTGALHWNGVTMSTSWTGSYVSLNAMWAGPTLGVFAAGGGGILRHAP